ncbi:MAG: helix-turn-helix transcriptional regulator [Pseudonocardiaceae bacterium]
MGRARELAWLGERATEARSGTPRLVVVEGEAGIGKTSLLRRFLSGLDGFTVLAASGDETETPLAYGVLTQLITATPTPVRSEFPLLSQTLVEDTAPFAVGAEFLALLGEVQSSGPVAVVVEDLHWADRASAEALAFTLRRLRNDSVLVLATARGGPAAPALDERWERLLRDDHWTTRLRVSGLAVTEIVALATALGLPRLPRASAQRLHAHTRGHPLHTQALLEELPPEALLHPDTRLPAPRSLAAVALSRLAGLPAPSRDLLAALAVLGSHASLGVAARLAGNLAPTLALEQATGAGFLDRAPSGMSIPITFRHPLLRAVIYDDLSPTRRRSLHAEAARLVAQRAAWPHRVAAAEHTDPALAAELDVAAAAEGDQHAAAATYLLWASDLSATGHERERRLLAAVARMLDRDPPRALAMRRAVLACADSPLRSYVLGFLASLAGELATAHRLLTSALTAALDAGDQHVVAAAAVRLATHHIFGTHGQDAAAAARTALAAEPADPWLIQQARMYLALGVALTEGADAGLAELADLPAAGVEVPPADAELLITRGVLHLYVGRFTAATDDLRTGIRRARDGARTILLHHAHLHLAQAQYQLGAWDDAVINAELGIELALDEERVWAYPMVHAVAALVPAGRGDTAAATTHLDLARQWSEQVSSPAGGLLIALAAAVLAQASEDHAGMLRALEPLAGAPRVGLMADAGAPWWPLYLEALIGTGHLRDAATVLQDWARRVEDGPAHLRTPLGWLLGWLSEHQGAPEQARKHYERALAVTGTDASPLSLARLRMSYGRLLHTAGDRRGARTQLQEARHHLAALGAGPYLRRVDAELTAAGARPHRPASGDPLGLTGQERQVAHLIVRGMTNKQAAAQLYVSAKTIEYHLGHIYTKLGITSRSQLHHRLNPAGVRT